MTAPSTDRWANTWGAKLRRRGLYLFPTTWNAGMYEIGGSRQIRGPDDLHGFKIRTPQSKITVDLFKTLGASPTPVGFDEVYTALQTKLIDGESAPVTTIAAARFNEINKYISLTRITIGQRAVWLNPRTPYGDIGKAFRPTCRAIISRNNTKYALACAQGSSSALNPALLTREARSPGSHLQSSGAGRVSRAGRLGSYFDEAAKIVGSRAIDLLQTSLGRKLT